MRKPGSICFIALAFMLAGLTTSCMSAQDARKPVAALSYEDVAPLPLLVSEVDIVNNYKPSADPLDVSSQFPTPPDTALRRFAERRLHPAGGHGVLRFVIEDARIYTKPVPAQAEMMRWLGVGEGMRYEVTADLRIYSVSDEGEESAHALMGFKKSLTIPDSYSIAKREATQLAFLKGLLMDIDKAVEEHLRQKMNLVAGTNTLNNEASMPPLSLQPDTLEGF